jgi:serine phosphatase RsbU (regulator of sigma subunit)
MLLYTDGITEAKNDKGEEYGYERLEVILSESKGKSPQEIKECLISSLYEFSGTENLDDDYTAMVVKFK